MQFPKFNALLAGPMGDKRRWDKPALPKGASPPPVATAMSAHMLQLLAQTKMQAKVSRARLGTL
jgi:hypothetical protein